MSVKVEVREKVLSGERNSLYLDFYPGIPGKFHPVSGKPLRREFLKLYVYKNPKAPAQKLHNKVTRESAELIKGNRRNEVNKPEIYTGFEKEQLRVKELSEGSFIEYFKRLTEKREGRSREGWIASFKYFVRFAGENARFADITEALCERFGDYLSTEKVARGERVRLSKNSASVYFAKFKKALRHAYKDGLIQVDMNAKIQPLETEETERTFLTLDEVNTLIQTECHNPIIKKAAIFSVFTGLRFSDIQNLTWGDVTHRDGEGYFINFRQQKTKAYEVMPISGEAFNLLGPAGSPDAKVFEGLYYSAYHNRHIAKWIGLAGITRHITFHTFRHTFATLQITLGTDIYTVSKMLGHRDLKTTQIYAKIVDQAKRTAANKIQLNVSNWK